MSFSWYMGCNDIDLSEYSFFVYVLLAVLGSYSDVTPRQFFNVQVQTLYISSFVHMSISIFDALNYFARGNQNSNHEN